ncbi:MAG: 4Fe-4S ferredoxin [Planctomycetota bacterium]|jgi:ferredoxin
MNETENKLRDAVRGLFADGKIDTMIGYETGTLPLCSRPCFLASADDVDRLVWNRHCSNNLAVYLPRLFKAQGHGGKEPPAPPKVAIVAKACDVRSIIGLVKEHQIPRENVTIVAVPCQGFVDLAKVAAALDGQAIRACEGDSEGTLRVTTVSGDEKAISVAEVIADACLECRHPASDGVDVLVEGEARESATEGRPNMDEFEARSPQERWEYFQSEISKCIRCYACRQACPNCYCEVCFADQTKPSWIGPGDDLSDVMLYHIGRIFHQAGRCVECDACVRACPMGIDLRLFTQKLAKDVEDLFGYSPGLAADEPPPLCTFKEDDSEQFITEP